MSGDESALQHSEHGRSEFRDAVDDAADIGKKGEDGCVCDAYSVHFHAELSGLSDGGLSELGVIRLTIGNDEDHLARFRHGVKFLQCPP